MERAWSHHWYEVDRGRESGRFEAVLEREAASHPERPARYLLRGLYDQQISAFLACFPLERMHFVVSEQLYEDPHAALSGVYAFLEVDAQFRGDRPGQVRNSSARVGRLGWLRRLAGRRESARSKSQRRLRSLHSRLAPARRPDMEPATRDWLRDFYAPHNAALEKRTGLDLSVWI